MRHLVLLPIALIALTGYSADISKEKPSAKKYLRSSLSNIFPDAVSGVSDENYAKVKRALLATHGDESIVAARKEVDKIKERARFVKGRNESEDLRMDFEKARDALVKATLEAVAKVDPTIPKDDLVLVLNAIEEIIKKRGQENARAAQEKAASESKASAANQPKGTPTPTADDSSKIDAEKPMTPKELLADVEGVSAEDMRAFRIAAFKSQRDPRVKELKAKQAQLRKESEFMSAEEKRNQRGEFEALQADLRKANLAAITQNAPSLSKETIETIYEAVETRKRDELMKSAKKSASKTPLKPFPFGEKNTTAK